MTNETPKKVVEKHSTNSERSKIKWEVNDNLFDSLGFFSWSLAMWGIDFFADNIKDQKWIPSEYADLLLWVSSCDVAMIHANDIIMEEESREDSRFEKDENGEIKRVYKYKWINRNELSDDEEREKTAAFLLNPRKDKKYIAIVAKNMDAFTKISVKWLKVLNEAWYGKEVSEYVRKNKKYVKKS